MKNLLLSLFVFLGTSLAYGETFYNVENVPNPKSKGDGHITDTEGILDENQIELIEGYCSELDVKGFETAVVIIGSTGGADPIMFATDLGNHWGVGKGDNGVVFLVAVNDRKMAIAVGENAEEVLPDLVTKALQTQDVIPHFKNGNMGLGIQMGILQLRNIVYENDVPDYAREDYAHDQWNESNQFTYQELERIKQWEIMGLIALVLILVLGFVVSATTKFLIQSSIILAASWVIAFIAYLTVLKEIEFGFIVAIGTGLSFIALSVNTFMHIDKESKEIWPKAIFLTLTSFVIFYGFYVHKMYAILELYFVGAGVIFGAFLLTYAGSMFAKDYYQKYHIIKVFKLDVFSYLFPMPMYIVDLFVEDQLDTWRNTVRFSKKTGLQMRKLGEVEDNKYLSTGQITEENVKSVDYDVWISEEKGDVLILRYSSWFSGYSTCSRCKHKTWHLEYDRTITSATYSSSGVGEKKKACAHCKHSKITRYTIPKLQKSSSSSGGYSGGSSWSGGSSSGGSWGGGSFGGGGSSSSW